MAAAAVKDNKPSRCHIPSRMEHLIFHHNGREYTIYDALTFDEIRMIIKMSEERDRKLNPLNAKSARKYFDDTDRMAAAILRRCFRMTDGQIRDIEQTERRSLASAFIQFLRSANGL
jgi:hypothetical protein